MSLYRGFNDYQHIEDVPEVPEQCSFRTGVSFLLCVCVGVLFICLAL